MTMKINLSGPDITDLEIDYVVNVLNTRHLSLGPKLPEFEDKVADYVGSRYAVAVNSGTSGLHLLVRSLGWGSGDKVITTPFSFIASSNCLLYENVEPVFIDIDPKTMNLDVDKVDAWLEQEHAAGRGDQVKGILPVHVFGQPCNMDRIMALAAKYNLKVLEDSCEAIGASYTFENTLDGRFQAGTRKYAGTMGNAGIYAFYPNKQITTGEGGMIVTDDEEIANLCKSMRNQGRNVDGKWLAHVRLGYNYRLSDINCALGLAQMERIDEILEKRSSVANLYNQKLAQIKGVNIPYLASNIEMSWFVYVIRLDDQYTRDDRDRLMQELLKNGIGCNNYFPPIHLQPFYMQEFGYKAGDFPVTEHIADRTIALPFYSSLTEKEMDQVCSVLKQSLNVITMSDKSVPVI